MANRKRVGQGLTAVGSALLLISAGFHSIGGYAPISTTLRATTLEGSMVRAMMAIWLMIGWHWAAFAIIALIGCFGRGGPRRVLMLLAGLVALVDAGGIYSAIGLFIGDEILAVAAVALLAGALVLPSAE